MNKPRKPTIDERLQAVIQSLELLVSRRRDMEECRDSGATALHQLALIARDALTSIQSLERIATAHQRFDDHDQRS